MSEQIERQIAELTRLENLTNEQIDRLNDAVFQFSFLRPARAKEIGQQTLMFAAKNDYWRGSGYALKNIGWCNLNLDDCSQAEESLKRSRKILAAARDQAGLATVFNGLATVKRKNGDFKNATEYYSTALELFEQERNQAGCSGVLLNLGIVHNQSGDYAAALDYYYNALPLAAAANAQTVMARTYTCLGDVLWRVNESELAIENLRQAISIFEKYPDNRNLCVALVNLGAAFHKQRNYSEAINYYQKGLTAAQATGNLETQSEAHKCLGSVYLETNQMPRAISHLYSALELARRVNNLYFESETLLKLGSMEHRLGNFAAGIDYLRQALEMSAELELNEINYQAHLALSEIYQEQQQAQTALFHHQAFHRIWSKLYNSTTWSKIQHLLFSQKLIQFSPPAAEMLSGAPITPPDNANVDDTLPPRKLQQVINFINHHLEHNLTVAKLAEIVGLSQSYFLLLFKKTTGKTPHQFLIECRVAHARKLLQTTNLPLSEIALQCGFSSQSHFSTHFRLITGMTPGQYRRSLQ